MNKTPHRVYNNHRKSYPYSSTSGRNLEKQAFHSCQRKEHISLILIQDCTHPMPQVTLCTIWQRLLTGCWRKERQRIAQLPASTLYLIKISMHKIGPSHWMWTMEIIIHKLMAYRHICGTFTMSILGQSNAVWQCKEMPLPREEWQACHKATDRSNKCISQHNGTNSLDGITYLP